MKYLRPNLIKTWENGNRLLERSDLELVETEADFIPTYLQLDETELAKCQTEIYHDEIDLDIEPTSLQYDKTELTDDQTELHLETALDFEPT